MIIFEIRLKITISELDTATFSYFFSLMEAYSYRRLTPINASGSGSRN